MNAFGFALPGQVLFGRGEAAKAPALIAGFGGRGVVVHGHSPARAAWLVDALRASGQQVTTLACGSEPTLPMLLDALESARAARPDWVVALGGGAAGLAGSVFAGAGAALFAVSFFPNDEQPRMAANSTTNPTVFFIILLLFCINYC